MWRGLLRRVSSLRNGKRRRGGGCDHLGRKRWQGGRKHGRSLLGLVVGRRTDEGGRLEMSVDESLESERK